MQSKSSSYVWLLTGVAALGGLLFGYDTGVISGAIGFLSKYWNLNKDMEGWAASSVLVGCILGAASAGMLSDWLGRKKVMLITAVLFTVSAVGSAVPRNLAEFAIARLLGGVGIGAASMLSPLYISEIAPAEIRGRLVSVNQFAIISGILLVYFVNAIVAHMGDRIGSEAWNVAYGWRWMFASGTLPAVLFLVMLTVVPESPRWLIKRGRLEEARGVLAKLGADAESQIAEIARTISGESGSIAQLFQSGIRKPMMIAIVLAVLQQITGINVVLYFAPEIFKSAGLEAKAAIVQTVAVGVVNGLFTVIAILIVDRIGRKPLLLLASLGMCVSLVLLGGAFVMQRFEGPWVLLFTLAYVASFAVAMGPVVWVVLAEIFPTRIRGTAMSVATVCLWVACWVVTQTFPKMLEELAGKSFFVYAVMCVISVIFVAIYVPETKGKTLEEIETWWKREKAA